VTAGTPLSSQAIGVGGRRELPGEWGGAAPDAARNAARRVQPERPAERRVTLRKP
jgi:hypothetical protein